MLEWYKCPDETIVSVKDCLAKCIQSERCLTLPTLTLIAQERKWTGTASTTQLLNGTMYSFLKLTQPYTVDPDSMAFALLGSKHHQQLSDVAKTLNLPSEIPLTDEDRDIFDLLEPDNGGWTLTDYKTWGSFRVAKCLGIVKTGKQPDPSGEVYKRAGAWGAAGSPKMIDVFQQVPSEADNWETEMQLNRYRIMLKERGLQIGRMQIQITVRDGGLAVSRSRGIERNTYMVPIKRLEDEETKRYFTTKANLLKVALEDKGWTNPCDNRECWDGVRCRDYCEVALFCPKGLIEQGGR
ncbi:hypothetical protein LCGC14_0383480 [marine sediment metagenome]|uniref:PD-(D/E)XK endonuclease-like domain-containing protein n=1 Tax=marine sediment metagenome TaxID=412755 RepID=A0A0F9T7M3_9ZZZZ